ncbi:MAG: small multi-drug export protein [Clostridia bacterium]|nr:small multi-drug export protein [Clostridia bacterium]
MKAGVLDRLTAMLPEEILVMLIAAMPVSELRGAIPFAQGVLGMPSETAFLWAVLGNILPAVLLLKYLGLLSEFLSRNCTRCRSFFNWLFARTRRKSEPIQRYGYLGLLLIVAIPLPATGAWTGSIAAWLLGLPIGKSLAAVIGGILIAGVLVSLAVNGTLSVLRTLI